MPINYVAIKKLREISNKRGLSLKELIEDINLFSISLIGKKSISRQTFHNLEKKESVCRLETIDLL